MLGFFRDVLTRDYLDAEVRIKVKSTILVVTTSHWFPAARLAMALANAGCAVEAVCPPKHPLGTTSVVRRRHTYDGLAGLTSFADAIAATRPDLIIPADDLATHHLHELYHRERHNGKADTPICSLIERSLGAPDSFPIVHARSRFMQVAQQEGIPVPKTEIIGHASDLRACIGRTGFPVVLKADCSSGGEGIRIAKTAEEAERAFRSLKAPPLLARAAKRALLDQDKRLVWPSLLRRRSTVNAQAFIAGREATSTVACWKGTLLAGLHFEVLKTAKSAGHATVVRLIENPEISAAVERIVRRLNLSGLHGFDFILESFTGNAYLIEINPRATQVGHLTLGPGRDLPAALLAALAGEAIRPAPKITENDTIALFPQEWMRDPGSAFLQSGYHDVPWEEPGLIRACVRGRRKQSAWYSQQNWLQAFSTLCLRTPTTAPTNGGVRTDKLRSKVGLDMDGRFEGVNSSSASAEPLEMHAASSTFSSERLLQRHLPRAQGDGAKPLRVMKFGGTSVADASCIGKVVEIIRAASQEGSVLVVVSAMSGVTNKLIQAAAHSEAGDCKSASIIFDQLRKQHDEELGALVSSAAEQDRIRCKMQERFQEGERLCQGTMLLRELSLRARDSISGLGERLSAPLVSASLAERGVASEAIEATDIVITDSCHGAAEPRMDLTRQRCEARLLPLLRRGIVPVVTGFIGATAEGVLTTLGRGGSDYSATILGAALGADEVIIWTDVDGLLTADPHVVPDACVIPEISYHQASELAYFGAKVLHPKTLRAVVPCGIPVWIRNTFAPEGRGTKIMPSGLANGGGAKALTSISDIALIAIGGSGIEGMPDALGRALAVTAAVRADVLLIHQSSSHDDICLVTSSACASRTFEALRREFAHDLASEKLRHIVHDPTVALITMVGPTLGALSGIVDRALSGLDRENVRIVASSSRASSECSFSFVVAKKDTKLALAIAHRALQSEGGEVTSAFYQKSLDRPATWYYLDPA